MNVSFSSAFEGKKVLVTGHTGFKGSWLSEWLSMLGAEVTGYALDPPTAPSHYDLVDLTARLARDLRGDVRDMDRLLSVVDEIKPDFVFHLAAQPIVRRSFHEPHETMETNLMGTVNVMEAIRRLAQGSVAVMITTDKVYENREWLHAYRENDRLGGYDPYSASKACAELAVSSYWRSFFLPRLAASEKSQVAMASARAGNVIGGGDWGADRLVPDCIRALGAGAPIPVRNKIATRPWQHVLEPLCGYLALAAEMAALRGSKEASDKERLLALCTPFNFAPRISSNRSVLHLVEEILKHWPGKWTDQSDPSAPHEAGRLDLCADKAFHLLGWAPHWPFETTVEKTVSWYREANKSGQSKTAVQRLTRDQIETYMSALNR